MSNREQEYAARIYEQVKDYGDEHSKDSKPRKQYGSMAHKLPILVRQAGLVQALAFVETRGKDPHKVLLQNLAEVVLDGDNPTAERLVTESRSADGGLQAYMYLTEKTLLALTWYKRFAQSVLNVKPTDEDDNEGGEDDS